MAARQGVSLRGAGISPKTEQLSTSAMALVLPFLETATDMEQLDAICEDWIEYEWTKGTTLGTIGDALCGLHYFWPQVKGCLRGSWKLYKNWRRLEVPQRAPPLPQFVALAFISLFLEWQEPVMAFLIALGFHCRLRTGEILNLLVKDISLDPERGVVTIRRSKTGLRFNIDQAISITDRALFQLWELIHLPRPCQPGSFLWSRSAQAFRDLFHGACRFFGLQALAFQPYSLRRGDATHDFQTSQHLDRILLRGRWRALAVARLYLEDGMAQMAQLRMSHKSKTLLATFNRGSSPLLLK